MYKMFVLGHFAHEMLLEQVTASNLLFTMTYSTMEMFKRKKISYLFLILFDILIMLTEYVSLCLFKVVILVNALSLKCTMKS